MLLGDSIRLTSCRCRSLQFVPDEMGDKTVVADRIPTSSCVAPRGYDPRTAERQDRPLFQVVFDVVLSDAIGRDKSDAEMSIRILTPLVVLAEKKFSNLILKFSSHSVFLGNITSLKKGNGS